jgi:hypothetical protein
MLSCCFSQHQCEQQIPIFAYSGNSEVISYEFAPKVRECLWLLYLGEYPSFFLNSSPLFLVGQTLEAFNPYFTDLLYFECAE